MGTHQYTTEHNDNSTVNSQPRRTARRHASALLCAAMAIGLFLTPALTYAAANSMPAADETLRSTPVAAGASSTISGTEFILQGISIGMSEPELIGILGEPARKDLSEYNFEWYIYNQNYQRYIQVGVQHGTVVALYTNAQDWTGAGGIGFGSTRQEVEAAYGSPLASLKKGNTIYKFKDNGGEYSLHQVGGAYATVFYDLSRKNTVTSIQLIDQKIELSFKGFYGKPSERLRESLEQEVLDLTNAVRVREGKKPLEWNDEIAATARKHSADMMKRDFFSHDNPDGQSPFDRMKQDGITYRMAGENIAAGQTSAIFAHENWMNSSGHRKNILNDFERLGVGISFGGPYQVYYTQNFFTPSR
ncbi:CAP-associated domain-containing protein [Paenibacillus thiaminolyticus]|uniref:CAP domain-containing protein n=1 Tax=Paenibacillus thiaminolyticus TaxID=49283 RepID=UPI003D2685F2